MNVPAAADHATSPAPRRRLVRPVRHRGLHQPRAARRAASHLGGRRRKLVNVRRQAPRVDYQASGDADAGTDSGASSTSSSSGATPAAAPSNESRTSQHFDRAARRPTLGDTSDSSGCNTTGTSNDRALVALPSPASASSSPRGSRKRKRALSPAAGPEPTPKKARTRAYAGAWGLAVGLSGAPTRKEPQSRKTPCAYPRSTCGVLAFFGLVLGTRGCVDGDDPRELRPKSSISSKTNTPRASRAKSRPATRDVELARQHHPTRQRHPGKRINQRSGRRAGRRARALEGSGRVPKNIALYACKSAARSASARRRVGPTFEEFSRRKRRPRTSSSTRYARHFRGQGQGPRDARSRAARRDRRRP